MNKTIKNYKICKISPIFFLNFVVRLYGYNKHRKPAYNLRLARREIIFRRFRIDELPQYFNILKGDMAIVGISLLSTMFNELSEHIQKERIKYKPGFISTYISLNMPDNDGNIKEGKIYLTERNLLAYLTNMIFFFRKFLIFYSKELRVH